MEIDNFSQKILPTKCAQSNAKLSMGVLTIAAGAFWFSYDRLGWPTESAKVETLSLIFLPLLLSSVICTVNLALRKEDDALSCRKDKVIYFTQDDNPNIANGIDYPITLFSDGVYLEPYKPICSEHRGYLEHRILNKTTQEHFCPYPGCSTTITDEQLHRSETAAVWSVGQKIFKEMNREPYSLSIYESIDRDIRERMSNEP